MSEMRRIDLDSGGYMDITLDFNLFTATDEDVAFVADILRLIRAHENRSGSSGEPTE